MDIDEHFERLESRKEDAVYWKNELLADNKVDKNVIFESLQCETVDYDILKCIELQTQNELTPAEESSLLKKLPKKSYDCILIYLNILLKRQNLPVLCQKTRQILENMSKSAPSPIHRRVELLTGESTITSVFEEDDLLVSHLLHSNQILVDFDEFAKQANYRDDLVLDFILYDCEDAKFLQVMLKIVKQRKIIQEKFRQLNKMMDKLIFTLKKCRKSLIYDPQALINSWERKL